MTMAQELIPGKRRKACIFYIALGLGVRAGYLPGT
jgi:hypothetical protein